VRVCLVGPGFRFLSGLSVYTCSLARALDEDFEVSVILLRQLLPTRLYPGSARVGAELTSLDYGGIEHFDGIDWAWGRSLLAAVRFMFRQRPQALVLQWWTAAVGHTYLVLALIARMIRLPVYLEIHELQDPGESANRAVRVYGRWMLSVLVRRCTGVLLHHEQDREQLLAAGLDLAGRRVAVAPHGPYGHLSDLPGRKPPELAVPAAGGSAASPVNILFFGLIRPYKGLEDLVEAFNSLPQQAAERLLLTVAGETWEGWATPVQMVEASAHRDRIRLVNRYVTDAEAAYLFAHADVLVLPYRRASSSGPLHIAMSQGLPVIMYDLPALRAACEGYEGAHFVPVGDLWGLRAALVRLSQEPYPRVRPAGSWTRTTAAYRQLVSGAV
jgi:glycosyltransferase involved in cell wall biosynthesis